MWARSVGGAWPPGTASVWDHLPVVSRAKDKLDRPRAVIDSWSVRAVQRSPEAGSARSIGRAANTTPLIDVQVKALAVGNRDAPRLLPLRDRILAVGGMSRPDALSADRSWNHGRNRSTYA